MPTPNLPWRRASAPVLLAALAALAGCATALAPPTSAPSAPPAAPVPAPVTTPAPAEVPAAAAAGADLDARFARWVADFRATARAAGIDEATLAAAFDDVHYLPRVVELDAAQPEFVRPVWDYLDRAVSEARVANGVAQREQARAEVDPASAATGVPASVLVAVWGLESDFGAHAGDIPTIDALATLAFDGRREAWARSELMAALRILQHGDIDRAHMLGSWAGAMGQTQFMPSSFLAVAVDADGDGRRDIWNDRADVMASTARLLARGGWRAGEPWGAEVRLPPGFDIARADGSTRRRSDDWAADGITAADGGALPALADAALWLPAGARGPALLLGANFRAIQRYNNSTSYALAVALLARRIDGGGGIVAPWPRDLVPLTRSQLRELQRALNDAGYAAGEVDGLLGPATRGALRRWQLAAGLPPDGFPTLELLQRLQGR